MEALKRRGQGVFMRKGGGRAYFQTDRHTHTPRVFTDTSTCIHKYYSPKDVECYTCQKVECRAVLGSAQKGSGEAKLLLFPFSSHITEHIQRAHGLASAF